MVTMLLDIEAVMIVPVVHVSPSTRYAATLYQMRMGKIGSLHLFYNFNFYRIVAR